MNQNVVMPTVIKKYDCDPQDILPVFIKNLLLIFIIITIAAYRYIKSIKKK